MLEYLALLVKYKLHIMYKKVCKGAFSMSIRQNIIKLREQQGITQEELAKIAGVSRGAVSQWEGGFSEPRMGAIQKIADHFHILKSNLIEDNGMLNYQLKRHCSKTMEHFVSLSIAKRVGRLTSNSCKLFHIMPRQQQDYCNHYTHC